MGVTSVIVTQGDEFTPARHPPFCPAWCHPMRHPAGQNGRGQAADVDVARSTARIAGRVGGELVALGRNRVTSDRVIPRRLADLTPAHLRAATGLPVESIERLDGTEGTTDRARLALTGDGVPSSVFVKMAAGSPGVRLFGGLARLGVTECRFYDEVRPGLGIEAPMVHGTAFDPVTRRFLIVLEDLAARGCAFTSVGSPLDVDQVGAVVETLAALHAANWRSSRLASTGDLAWVATNSGDALLPVVALGDAPARDAAGAA